MLSASPEIRAYQQRLPRPITALTEDVVVIVREALDHLVQTQRDLAPYAGLIAITRLERVWEILRMAAMVSRQTTDTLISNTNLGIVGALLFADL